MEFELKKNLLGGYTVAYECPRCKAGLRSKLDEAGNSDTCPDCGAPFTVPGADDRAHVRSEQNAAAQKKREVKAVAVQTRAKQKQRELVLREEESRQLRVVPPPAPKPVKSTIVDDRPVQCPRCGSSQVAANQKGFGLKNAVVGGLLLGPVGLLGGMVGSKKITITRLKCGTAFEPGQ